MAYSKEDLRNAVKVKSGTGVSIRATVARHNWYMVNKIAELI